MELLLSVGLLALVIGLSADIIVTLVRTNTKIQVLNEVEQEANFIFLRLQKDIRSALSATVTGGTQLSLPQADGTIIDYQVREDGGINWFERRLREDAGDTDAEFYSLTDPEATRGSIEITCLTYNKCFEKINSGTTPMAIKINLNIAQKNTLSKLFGASIRLTDTFIVRGSY